MERRIVTKEQIIKALMLDPEHPRNEKEAEAVYGPTVRYMLSWNMLKKLEEERFLINVMKGQTAELVRSAL